MTSKIPKPSSRSSSSRRIRKPHYFVLLLICSGYLIWSSFQVIPRFYYGGDDETVLQYPSSTSSSANTDVINKEKKNVTAAATQQFCSDGKTPMSGNVKLIKGKDYFEQPTEYHRRNNNTTAVFLDYWSDDAVKRRRRQAGANHERTFEIDSTILKPCRFHPTVTEKLKHFAHAMEQLYLCIDYWLADNNATDDDGNSTTTQHPVQPLLLLLYNATDQKPYWKKGLEMTSFLQGVWEVLETQLGVKQMTIQQFLTWKRLSGALEERRRAEQEGNHVSHSNVAEEDGQDHNDHNTTAMELLNQYFEEQDVKNPQLYGIPTFRDPLNGFLFRSTEQWNVLVRRHYGIVATPKQSFSCDDAPRITILSRRSTRSIVNANAIEQELSRRTAAMVGQQQISLSNVQVQYFENADFEQQIRILQQTDILISGHGAQLTGLPFMGGPCKQLLELYPKDYALPYYFGSLAVQAGIAHSYMYFSDDNDIVYPWEKRTASTYKERFQSRLVNLCPDTHAMVEAIVELVKDWHACCLTPQNRL